MGSGTPPDFVVKSAKPGADDGVGEAHSVAEDGGLLRVAVQALFDRDRDLDRGHARLIASIMNSEVWNCSCLSTRVGRTKIRTAR